MIGILGWNPNDVWSLTLRELVIAYDAKLVNQWDQSAMIATLTANISVVVLNLMGKRERPKQMTDFHPFRISKRRGAIITDIKLLKPVGDALVRQ